MNEKSVVESVAGDTTVTLTANTIPVLAQLFPAIGAAVGASGIPLLSAVPFLLQTLAAGRQAERIDRCIKSLADDVERLKCDLINISDDQYKLASECSLSFLSTINAEKLEYLRKAILNTLVDTNIANGTSEALGRLIRDISAEETQLVIALFKHQGVFVLDKPMEIPADCYAVLRGTKEEQLIGGLVRLGLLYSLESAWAGTRNNWSPLTAKFIALVKDMPGVR